MSPLDHEARLQLLEPLHPTLSLVRQSQLFDISRSSIYYEKVINPEEIAATHAIDLVFTECPFYGSRRIREALKNEHSIHIGREQAQRLMRLMGLEAVYPKPHLSKADKYHRVYPYLLKRLAIEYPNHVWGTDITYIKLKNGFCYLVAIIDWYSRKVIHWELSPTLEIDFCLTNITEALKVAVPTILNSDQGSHFTSPQHTDILLTAGVQISMDGRGRCMDNIFTERLWRSVKYENVFIHDYQTIEEAHSGLTNYFNFYNTKRPHQSLNYQTPDHVYFSKTGHILQNENAPLSIL